jgi:hypothetical protein
VGGRNRYLCFLSLSFSWLIGVFVVLIVSSFVQLHAPSSVGVLACLTIDYISWVCHVYHSLVSTCSSVIKFLRPSAHLFNLIHFMPPLLFHLLLLQCDSLLIGPIWITPTTLISSTVSNSSSSCIADWYHLVLHTPLSLCSLPVHCTVPLSCLYWYSSHSSLRSWGCVEC